MSRPAAPWIAGGVLLAAVAGCAMVLPRWLGKRADATVPTLKLEAAPFVRRVSALGNLRAARAQTIGVPTGVPGPFQVAWIAPDGAPVKAGDLVVRFEASKLQKDLKDAQADRDSSRFKTDKQQAESGAKIGNLRRDAGIARRELEDSRTFQKKDEMIYSRHQIIESDIDQTLATARERHARENERTQTSVSKTELELLGIDKKRAELKIGRAEDGLQSLEIKAPFDGVLVLERNWRGETVRVGDTVWNGQPLAQIPDLAVMEAEVYVLEADAGGLEPGKPAEVTVESDPDTVYHGKIARVDALAKPRLRGSPVQYFAVVVALDRTDTVRMKPGARVRATLKLDERAQALALPRQAVFERDGKNVAWKRTASGYAAVPITLGPAGLGRVVIEKGLAAGDVVALEDPEQPTEGAGAGPGKGAAAGKEKPPPPPPGGGGMVIIKSGGPPG